MTGAGRVRHFGFDLLPEAVADMDTVPRDVRAEAMDALYEVARGRVRGRPLEGRRGQEELNGCRRLYLGNADWRLVYVETPRRGDLGTRGVLVVVVGPRARGDVYTTAAQRLRTLRAALAGARTNPLADAARLRPGTAPTASGAVSAMPATAAPAAHPTRTRAHR
jgi:hypothetical protein